MELGAEDKQLPTLKLFDLNIVGSLPKCNTASMLFFESSDPLIRQQCLQMMQQKATAVPSWSQKLNMVKCLPTYG